MITLSATLTDDAIVRAQAELATMTDRQLQQAREDVTRLGDLLTSANLRDNLRANFSGVTGTDGVTYATVEFMVTARYTIGEDVWLEGGRFGINVSEFIRTMLEYMVK